MANEDLDTVLAKSLDWQLSLQRVATPFGVIGNQQALLVLDQIQLKGKV